MRRRKNDTDRKKICGIYKITSPTSRIYIGQSIDIEYRWDRYRILNCKSQCKLYRSLFKHGADKHVFEIVEECSRDLLNERELFWGLFYNVLNRDNLNLVLGNAKKVFSEDVKKMISRSLIGRATGFIISPEHRAKLNAGMKANPRSEEWRRQHSLRVKGVKLNPEHVEHIRLSVIGRKHSQEAKDKISVANKGNRHPYPEHAKEKLRIRILEFDLNGNLIKEWSGIRLASRELNISRSAIVFNLKGKHTQSAGFIWKYKNINNETSKEI